MKGSACPTPQLKEIKGKEKMKGVGLPDSVES